MNIDFPLGVDRRGRTATTGEDDHVRDLVEQVLFTAPGERVNRPDFGSGLRQLVFEPGSPEVAAAVQFTVQAALQRWLGDVVEVQSVEARSGEGELRVVVVYLVVRTGETREQTFERAGGT